MTYLPAPPLSETDLPGPDLPGPDLPELSDTQIERYARHLILDPIGDAGQQALLASRVLVVGAGGIGAPALMYLTASGVGNISVLDDDLVDLSNLQRQILFNQTDPGKPKAEQAKARLSAQNPDPLITPLNQRLTAQNADSIIAGPPPVPGRNPPPKFDLVIDGSDSYDTRTIVAGTCFTRKVPLVSAAASQFDGQLAVFRPWLENRPCYTCLFPNAPAGPVSCAETGIFAPLTGIAGTLAANEALKLLIGLDTDDQSLLLIDGLSLEFTKLKAFKTAGCRVCRA